jgi:hypothetical protein
MIGRVVAMIECAIAVIESCGRVIESCIDRISPSGWVIEKCVDMIERAIATSQSFHHDDRAVIMRVHVASGAMHVVQSRMHTGAAALFTCTSW